MSFTPLAHTAYLQHTHIYYISFLDLPSFTYLFVNYYVLSHTGFLCYVSTSMVTGPVIWNFGMLS